MAFILALEIGQVHEFRLDIASDFHFQRADIWIIGKRVQTSSLLEMASSLETTGQTKAETTASGMTMQNRVDDRVETSLALNTQRLNQRLKQRQQRRRETTGARGTRSGTLEAALAGKLKAGKLKSSFNLVRWTY